MYGCGIADVLEEGNGILEGVEDVVG